MFEKVNPSHPDKVADRIAGAIVDFAYKCENNPTVAVEVLIGHGVCSVIVETSVKDIHRYDVERIISHICREENEDELEMSLVKIVPQDKHLRDNQKDGLRCGDNGIFKGCPVSREQRTLSDAVRKMYEQFRSDGKFIASLYGGENENDVTICQSMASREALEEAWPFPCNLTINPLGGWSGGVGVDSGATNRKLGSDMGDAVTGGGLHGKDLSKADVSVNIYCHLKAQEKGQPVTAVCSIGDKNVLVDGDEVPFKDIVNEARTYIDSVGGFEKFAEWGLI